MNSPALSIDSTAPDELPAVTVPVTREWFEALPSSPSWREFPLRAAARLGQAVLGALCGIVLLALMASVPVLNVLALGYLLGMVGRVARTGKLGAALFLAPITARVAGMLLFGALLTFPLRFLAELARDATMLAPWSFTACCWTLLAVAVSLLVTLHVILAMGRGGSWWWFFRPLNNLRWTKARLRDGTYLAQADQTLRTLVIALQPWQHFRLGLFGFAGVYLWMLLPALVFDQAPAFSGAGRVFTSLVGGAALVLLFGWMPFLLTHYAVENRWQAWLDWKGIRQRFRHSPFCWTLSALLLYGLSMLVMLYVALVKNKMPTHEARWDVMIVFMVTLIPAKLFVAWVWQRAGRVKESWRSWQWFNRALLAFGLGWYVYFIFLAHTGGQLGQSALWQFHSLLLPFP